MLYCTHSELFKCFAGYIYFFYFSTLMIHFSQLVAFQKAFIYDRIKAQSQSHIVHPGSSQRITSFADSPALVASGWVTSQQAGNVRGSERDRNLVQSKINNTLKQMLDKVKANEHAWPFGLPVKKSEVHNLKL
jgi:hypothetical protein